MESVRNRSAEAPELKAPLPWVRQKRWRSAGPSQRLLRATSVPWLPDPTRVRRADPLTWTPQRTVPAVDGCRESAVQPRSGSAFQRLAPGKFLRPWRRLAGVPWSLQQASRRSLASDRRAEPSLPLVRAREARHCPCSVARLADSARNPFWRSNLFA